MSFIFRKLFASLLVLALGFDFHLAHAALAPSPSKGNSITLVRQEAFVSIPLWTGVWSISKRLTGKLRQEVHAWLPGWILAQGMEGYERVTREEGTFHWPEIFSEDHNSLSG